MKKYFYFIIVLIVACQSDIGDRERIINHSVALYHQQDFNGAIKIASEYVINYPNDALGWQIISSAYLAVGNDSMCESAAKNALLIEPKNPIAMLNLAILCDKKSNYTTAYSLYEGALKHGSDLVQVYSNFASNRLFVGDYQRAIELGERAVQLGNSDKDKGILCVSYHKIGDTTNVNRLLLDLRKNNYQNLRKLEELLESE